MADIDYRNFIDIIAETGFVTKRDARKIYYTLMDRMFDAIVSGDSVTLKGICKLTTKVWPERRAFNPNTREVIVVKPRRQFQTIVSRKIRDAIWKVDGVK